MHDYQVGGPVDVYEISYSLSIFNSINAFTMTAGQTLALTGLATGTTVNLLGDIKFGVRFVHASQF